MWFLFLLYNNAFLSRNILFICSAHPLFRTTQHEITIHTDISGAQKLAKNIRNVRNTLATNDKKVVTYI